MFYSTANIYVCIEIEVRASIYACAEIEVRAKISRTNMYNILFC